jgi:hypothetical protein
MNMENSMKSKFFVSVLLIFVSVSFITCGGDSPKMVKEVKVTAVGIDYYILTWEAKGKNVLDYEVFAKQKDKSSIFQVAAGISDLSGSIDLDGNPSIATEKLAGGIVTNQVTFVSLANTFTFAPNTDVDKWNALVSTINIVPVSGKYYLGVRTISTSADYSDIKWSKDEYNLISGLMTGIVGGLPY